MNIHYFIHLFTCKLNQYFENGGSGRRIAIGVIDDKKIVSFVRMNHDNKKRMLPNFLLKFFTQKVDEGSISFVRIDQNYYSKDLYDNKYILTTVGEVSKFSSILKEYKISNPSSLFPSGNYELMSSLTRYYYDNKFYSKGLYE